MFLHLCVILFTGIGVDFPACITGHMTGEGVCIQGGRVYIQWGGLHPMGDLHPMGRSASNGEVCIQWGGLHPMGRFVSNGKVCIQWGGLHPMGRCASNGEVCIQWMVCIQGFREDPSSGSYLNAFLLAYSSLAFCCILSSVLFGITVLVLKSLRSSVHF